MLQAQDYAKTSLDKVNLSRIALSSNLFSDKLLTIFFLDQIHTFSEWKAPTVL